MISLAHHSQRCPEVVSLLLALLCKATAAMAADDPPSAPPAKISTVVVVSKELPVETFIDRKVYRLTDELQATFGTLSDVLTDIPSVSVDPDGVLTLRGDSNVLILIDGKPSPLFSGSNAGANLQSYPAANIERIEVITTPPPQYRAAGAAGAINIVTRKAHNEGMAGGVRASQGTKGRYIVSANSSYRSEKLSVTVDAGFRHDARQKLLESDMRSPLSPAAMTLDSRTSLLEHRWRDVPTANASAEYALDEKDSLSGSFSWLKTNVSHTYNQTTTTTDSSGTVTGLSERLSRGHSPETDYDARLGYVRKLARTGEELHVSLHRATSHPVTLYDYINNSLLPEAMPNDSYLILDEENATSEAEVDYILPLSNVQELKFGYLFEQDDFSFESTAGDEDPLTRTATLNLTAIDEFKYRQRIHAGYASYKANAGKWSLLGGLRLEGTSTNALVPTDGTSARDSYLGLFPSLRLERSVSDAGTLSFSASRRLTRPNPKQLDPNVNQEYTLILRAGNLHLRPAYTQSYELGYGFQGHNLSYQVTGYYRRNDDTTIGVVKYIGDGVSLSTQENLHGDDFAGLELTADGHLGSQLSYSISGNLYRKQVDPGALDILGPRSGQGADAKFKLDYRPTASDFIQLRASHTGHQSSVQGSSSAMDVVNIGYRRQLKANLSALATVTDVFNGQRTQNTVTTPYFTGFFVRAIRGPNVYVGLNYSFGSRGKKDADLRYEQ